MVSAGWLQASRKGLAVGKFRQSKHSFFDILGGPGDLAVLESRKSHITNLESLL